MKKAVLASIIFLVFASASFGEILIDNFADNNYTKNPVWWTFGNLNLQVTKDSTLSVVGKASDWYVGGIGTYIAGDGRDFATVNYLTMDVIGNGPDSGTLKVQLYDDDNGNWQVEQDKNFQSMYDDRFEAELKVDWKGLKKVSIPLSEFKDTNPNVGDNILNPGKINSSGGLLQMQIIAVASSKTGAVNLQIGNILFK
jgi:hypothetical protein